MKVEKLTALARKADELLTEFKAEFPVRKTVIEKSVCDDLTNACRRIQTLKYLAEHPAEKN